MPHLKTIQPQKSAGESVYEFLRNSIIQLWFKPGQRLNIRELTEYLKVSRSPIRDALIRLGKEGLIVSEPQRSTLVSKIDVDRASNEFFLRLCVEEKVVEQFVDVATKENIRFLEENIAAQKKSRDSNDYRAFLNQDDQFHQYFYEQTDKGVCFQLLHDNIGHYNRVRLLSCMEEPMLDDTINQHEELIELIRRREKREARRSVYSHLMKINLDVPKLTEKYPKLFVGVAAKQEHTSSIFRTDYLDTLMSV